VDKVRADHRVLCQVFEQTVQARAVAFEALRANPRFF
jgi:hypothetical protein